MTVEEAEREVIAAREALSDAADYLALARQYADAQLQRLIDAEVTLTRVQRARRDAP